MSTPFDDFRSLLPGGTEWLSALTWLGTQDWVDAKPVRDNESELTFSLVLTPPNETIRQQLQWLFDHKHLMNPLAINALAKSVSSGQKLLRPTFDQCRAMEQVTINLSHDEYQQPYPSIFVELPAEYRKELGQQLGVACPRYLLCSHDPASKYIITLARSNDNQFISCISSPRYDQIEESLGVTAEEPGADFELLKTLGRIAINMCLMLTHLGVKERGYVNSGEVKKLLKRSKNAKRNKAGRADAELAALPKLITFAQDIEFYEKESSYSDDVSDGPETGTPKQPHWRRGHFRQQRWGKERANTKLVFIKPLMVNRRRFVGSDSETLVTYRGR